MVPYVSATGSTRTVFLLVIDLLLPYYVLSRSCTNKQSIVEAISALALAAMVLAPLAMFEAAKSWLLYSGIGSHWQVDSNIFGYLRRSDFLRAQVTSGQSIVLGNFYAVVLGLWLYLQSKMSAQRRWLGTAAIGQPAGLAFPRPMGRRHRLQLCFLRLRTQSSTRVLKFASLSAVIAGIALSVSNGRSDH